MVALAAADGWEEGDFITGMEHSIPGSELLITGSYNRRAVFGKFGNALAIKSKELLDGGGVRKIQRFLSVANKILQTAEEKDLHPDSL